MSAWKTIGSANRDGSFIIAARFRNGDELCWVRDAYWRTAEDMAAEYDESPDDYEAAWVCPRDEDDPIYPTHWMELTPPDKSEGAAA